MNPDPNRVTVVIVAYNKAQYTQYCLRSLLHARYRPLRIIIVNNGSTDGTAALLDAFAPAAAATSIDFTAISMAENTGAIHSRNRALEEIDDGLVVFMDNDVVLRSIDLFDQLRDYLLEHSEVGAIGPKFVYPRPPYPVQSAGGVTTREGLCYLVGRGEARTAMPFNLIQPRPWLITACLMVPMRVLREVGPFDPVYHPIYFEDVDLCCRIHTRGYRIIYYPKVELYHFENVSTASVPSAEMRHIFRRNQRIFWRRWRHLFAQAQSTDDLPWVWRSIPRVPTELIETFTCVEGDCTRIP
jgi:GT2 family glycosyltransferase